MGWDLHLRRALLVDFFISFFFIKYAYYRLVLSVDRLTQDGMEAD